MAKIIFLGTPDYVLPVLDTLVKEHEILGVVTQPPKPVGRKQVLTPSPIAQWAQLHSIKVFDDPPKKIVQSIKELRADVGVLAAYGRILQPEILEVFPKGILNIHLSILPKHRGPSPVAAAIAAGDKQTGVTIIKLDEEMDHGSIVAQFTEEIKDDDTAATLRDRLFKAAAQTLIEILPHYLERRIEVREQDHAQATYTKIIKKEHGFIPPEYIEGALQGVALQKEWPICFIRDYSLTPSSYVLECFIRALSPWPVAWTNIKLTSYQVNKLARLKILKAHTEEGKLVLDQVQLEGKNPVSWQQFVQGYPGYQFA